jgi:hypothetical protein
MFCRILKQNYGHFDEKCVGGNDVFIKKIASCIGLHQLLFIFIGAEFSKLSIKHYKPVEGVGGGTQIDDLNFKLSRPHLGRLCTWDQITLGTNMHLGP